MDNKLDRQINRIDGYCIRKIDRQIEYKDSTLKIQIDILVGYLYQKDRQTDTINREYFRKLDRLIEQIDNIIKRWIDILN